MNIYEPHEIQLANEIAETLKDRDAMPLYLSYCRKYQEAFLRRMLARVMAIEQHKIRKTRAALFTFLVSQNGRPIILGISFSTRMIGVAVFKGNHLIDYSVTLIKQQWSLEKLNRFITVITSQLTHHNIDVITLVSPQKRHQSIEYTAIIDAIAALATEYAIPITTYTIKDIYLAFASMAYGTRASLMHRIAMFYPELEQYEQREMQNKHRYYIKLFEAVGSALLHILRVQEIQGYPCFFVCSSLHYSLHPQVLFLYVHCYVEVLFSELRSCLS